MTKNIGINLKSARKRCGLTQSELASLAGVSQNHIAQIETGKRAPSLIVLERLATHVEVSASELLEDVPVSKELKRLLDLVGLKRLRSELEELARTHG